MIDQFSNEIFLYICQFLSFRDIMSLRKTNAKLFTITTQIASYIITKELGRFDVIVSKKNINLIITDFIYNLFETEKNKISNKENLTNGQLMNTIIWKIKDICISHNPYINLMTQRLIYHYITRGSLISYDAPIELFIYYNLIEIDVFKNMKNVNYNIQFVYDFLELSNYHYYGLQTACGYFETVLYNNIAILLKSSLLISGYVCNLSLIKKLYGLTIMNLKHSYLILSNSESIYDDLNEIVTLKTNLPSDDLLSYNYLQIKPFLEKQNIDLSYYLKELELTFINKKIVYRDPFVGNHIRLTSRASQILLYRLKYEMPQVDNIRKIQQRLDRYIEKRQNELLICYFN